jgi:hypothetical protein
VAATLATAVAWRRHHRDLTRAHHLRLGLLFTAGLLFMPWVA